MPSTPTQTSIKKSTPITIGSDPEMILYSPFTNEMISADSCINDNDHTKPFGTDGHSSTAEIRPKPSVNPLQHAKNIKNLFLSYAKQTTYKPVYELSFYPSSINDSIGGHIHFGHPLISWKETFSNGTNRYNYYEMLVREILGQQLTPEIYQNGGQDLIDALGHKVEHNRTVLSNNLDMLLAFPLMFTEIPEHAQHRKGNYGALSDYRGKDYGIEYRTTPCWIASEKLTKAVLTLAYATAYDTLENNYKPQKNFTQIRGFNNNFQIHNTELLKPFLNQTEAEIHKLSLYPKYKEYINYLLYHAKRGTELMDTEIKLGWGIPFKIISQITLMTVRELTEKVSLALSIPKSERQAVQIHTPYVTAKSSDYMIPQIKDNINTCLNKIVSQSEQNKQAISIFAKKREYGDIVTIDYDYNSCITTGKQRQLKNLINAVGKTFGYENDIQVTMASDYDEERITPRVRQVARVGIGRAIREQPNYLSEAIVFTILLFFNNTIYQGYTINRKTGQRKNSPLTARTIVSQFKKNLADKTKRLPPVSEEDTEEAREEANESTRMSVNEWNDARLPNMPSDNDVENE